MTWQPQKAPKNRDARHFFQDEESANQKLQAREEGTTLTEMARIRLSFWLTGTNECTGVSREELEGVRTNAHFKSKICVV